MICRNAGQSSDDKLFCIKTATKNKRGGDANRGKLEPRSNWLAEEISVTIKIRNNLNVTRFNELNQGGWSKVCAATPRDENVSCGVIDHRGCIFTVNQHGWSKFCLATLVQENTDCTFSDSRDCIFTVKVIK